MGINRFYRPGVSQYTSQFVKAPFEYLQGQIDKKDLLYQKAQNAENKVLENIMNIKPISGVYSKEAIQFHQNKKEEVLNHFRNEIDNIYKKYNGDLARAIPDIEKLNREYNESITNGDLAKIIQSRKNQEAYQTSLGELGNKADPLYETTIGGLSIAQGYNPGNEFKSSGNFNVAPSLTAWETKNVEKDVYSPIGAMIKDDRITVESGVIYVTDENGNKVNTGMTTKRMRGGINEQKIIGATLHAFNVLENNSDRGYYTQESALMNSEYNPNAIEASYRWYSKMFGKDESGKDKSDEQLLKEFQENISNGTLTKNILKDFAIKDKIYDYFASKKRTLSSTVNTGEAAYAAYQRKQQQQKLTNALNAYENALPTPSPGEDSAFNPENWNTNKSWFSKAAEVFGLFGIGQDRVKETREKIAKTLGKNVDDLTNGDIDKYEEIQTKNLSVSGKDLNLQFLDALMFDVERTLEKWDLSLRMQEAQSDIGKTSEDKVRETENLVKSDPEYALIYNQELTNLKKQYSELNNIPLDQVDEVFDEKFGTPEGKVVLNRTIFERLSNGLRTTLENGIHESFTPLTKDESKYYTNLLVGPNGKTKLAAYVPFIPYDQNSGEYDAANAKTAKDFTNITNGKISGTLVAVGKSEWGSIAGKGILTNIEGDTYFVPSEPPDTPKGIINAKVNQLMQYKQDWRRGISNDVIIGSKRLKLIDNGDGTSMLYITNKDDKFKIKNVSGGYNITAPTLEMISFPSNKSKDDIVSDIIHYSTKILSE